MFMFVFLGLDLSYSLTARGRRRRWLLLQLCKYTRTRRHIVHTTHSACDATNSRRRGRRRSLQRTAMGAPSCGKNAGGRGEGGGGGRGEAMWRTGPLSTTGRRVPAPDGLQLVTVRSFIHGARWWWPRGNLFPGLSVLTWSFREGPRPQGYSKSSFLIIIIKKLILIFGFFKKKFKDYALFCRLNGGNVELKNRSLWLVGSVPNILELACPPPPPKVPDTCHRARRPEFFFK
jgi:hypothetical protein